MTGEELGGEIDWEVNEFAAVAFHTSANGVVRRSIRWCCGNHRTDDCCEGSKCVACCPECPTCPAVQRRAPSGGAADAAELRERQMLLRVAAHRAETLAVIAGLDELASELERQTRVLVDVAANADEASGVQEDLDKLAAAVQGFAKLGGQP